MWRSASSCWRQPLFGGGISGCGERTVPTALRYLVGAGTDRISRSRVSEKCRAVPPKSLSLHWPLKPFGGRWPSPGTVCFCSPAIAIGVGIKLRPRRLGARLFGGRRFHTPASTLPAPPIPRASPPPAHPPPAPRPRPPPHPPPP